MRRPCVHEAVYVDYRRARYVLSALEEAIERGDIQESAVTQELLEGFLGGFGRKFYGIPDSSGERIRLRRASTTIADKVTGADGIEVVPFRRGQKTWSLEWI